MTSPIIIDAGHITFPIPLDNLGDARQPGLYRQISPGHALHKAQLRPSALVDQGARHHPRNFRYAAPAATRVIAHLRERPSLVASSWSAAALFGLRYFCDDADTCVLGSVDRSTPMNVLEVDQRRLHKSVTLWTVRLGEDSFRVVSPILSLVGCLRSLHHREHSWETVPVPGLDPVTVRMVQVVDQFRRVLGLDEEQIRAGAASRFSSRRLGRILALSSPLAESPKETELRLLIHQITSDLGATLLEQVPVYKNGQVGASGTRDDGAELLTIIDIADVPRMIAFMYDGEHHLDRAQRDLDARITAELTRRGWLVIRVSAGMLRDTKEITRQIRESFLARAEFGRMVG